MQSLTPSTLSPILGFLDSPISTLTEISRVSKPMRVITELVMENLLIECNQHSILKKYKIVLLSPEESSWVKYSEFFSNLKRVAEKWNLEVKPTILINELENIVSLIDDTSLVNFLLTALSDQSAQCSAVQGIFMEAQKIHPEPVRTKIIAKKYREWISHNQLPLSNLSYLRIFQSIIHTLPPEIKYFTGLKSLKIIQCNLLTLPPEIIELTALNELDLSGNQLSTLPQLESLINLKKLDLSNNKLESLPPQVGSLINLEKLDLENNQLSSLPPQIGSLVNLKRLNLGNNQLASLPPQIGSLVNLKRLNLGNNQLASLPPQVGSLVNLKLLSLLNNSLSNLPLLSGLIKLTFFNIAQNNFSEFPDELRELEAFKKAILPPQRDPLGVITES